MSNALVGNITIGNPEIVRSRPVLVRSQTGFDTLRQTILVHHIEDEFAARAAARAHVGLEYSITAPNYYWATAVEAERLPEGGWKFDVEYSGKEDLSQRHRLSTTNHENVTWTFGDHSYEILIPRMTIVDLWFSYGAPNWSQQGKAFIPPSAPTPPLMPPWAASKVVVHIPHGWVLMSRESEFVGPFPGILHAVTDTVTFFEIARPASF